MTQYYSWEVTPLVAMKNFLMLKMYCFQSLGLLDQERTLKKLFLYLKHFGKEKLIAH